MLASTSFVEFPQLQSNPAVFSCPPPQTYDINDQCLINADGEDGEKRINLWSTLIPHIANMANGTTPTSFSLHLTRDSWCPPSSGGSNLLLYCIFSPPPLPPSTNPRASSFPLTQQPALFTILLPFPWKAIHKPTHAQRAKLLIWSSVLSFYHTTVGYNVVKMQCILADHMTQFHKPPLYPKQSFTSITTNFWSDPPHHLISTLLSIQLSTPGPNCDRTLFRGSLWFEFYCTAIPITHYHLPNHTAQPNCPFLWLTLLYSSPRCTYSKVRSSCQMALFNLLALYPNLLSGPLSSSPFHMPHDLADCELLRA